jgi:hypothetical protein
MKPVVRMLGLFVAYALLSGCTIWKEKQPHTWKSATGVEQYERLWWQEMKAGNWPEVERRLAATYVSVTPSGTRDRAQTIERLRQLGVQDYTLGNLEVHPAGSDMVVTYEITIRTASSSETSYVLGTWQPYEGGWVAIAHSFTPKQ